MSGDVEQVFEHTFFSRPLAELIRDCDTNELAPVFASFFGVGNLILEAGCGTGQWNAWLGEHGIRSVGLDWSHRLCARARAALPSISFVSGDLTRLPFRSDSFDGLCALGSIEHIHTGPTEILSEFLRVLTPGGVAVITVPNGGRLRLLQRLLERPRDYLQSRPWLRRLLRKKGAGKRTLEEARRETIRAWHPRFSVGDNGYFFYEYEFSSSQMRSFISIAGFRIDQESVVFHDDGLMSFFGPLMGTRGKRWQDIRFTRLGHLLKRLIPVALSGHMLCFVLVKPNR